MNGSPTPRDGRWLERSVTAAMVIAGFAVGSLGLTVAAELLGDEPVLTDEFNAPVAEDDDTGGVVSITATTTTVPPAATIEPDPIEVTDDGDGDAHDRRDRAERERSDRRDRRDARERA